ncbi:hypothetical protein NCCP133_07530 [Cytobacillus sp. NCCP-133]|nr:hypothetical protein NCCP133_07530 [Cytobacillus sp. NCCP-133]
MILENAFAFSSCGVYPEKFIQCPAERDRETPQTQGVEELCSSVDFRCVPAAEVNGLKYHNL